MRQNMATKAQRDQYNRDRARVCEDLGISVATYNYFRRQGERLHRLYEANCNGFHTEEEQTAHDALEEKVEKIVEQRATKIGLHIYFQGDPRGATIYLSKDPISYDNYNRFGSHCIY